MSLESFAFSRVAIVFRLWKISACIQVLISLISVLTYCSKFSHDKRFAGGND